MIETDNARFELTVKAKVKEKITGEVFISDLVRLVARGYYKSWWEYPDEPQYGQVNYIEQEIDNDTIEVDDDGIELIKILQDIEDYNWNVIEKSLE